MAKIDIVKYDIDGKTLIIRSPEANDRDGKQLLNHVEIINKETDYLIREADEFDFTVKKQKSFIRARINSAINLFIVAEINGEIIGSCILSGSNLKREKHKVDLGVSVQKKYWSLGIGRKLLEEAMDWGKENNIKKITLKVDATNYRAISLYMKLGFKVEGSLYKDKYMSDKTYRNSYLMGLILD